MHDQIPQPVSEAEPMAIPDKETTAARDERVSSKVVVELPKRADVTEYVVIKCTGAFPTGAKAAMASAACINSLWPKVGTGIIVPPIELKQQLGRDGDVRSVGLCELVRKPLGVLDDTGQNGLDGVDAKISRIRADVTAATSLCPLQKAGRLGAKCNYLSLMIHNYLNFGPNKDKPGMPKQYEIFFAPSGIDSPLDRAWGMRPVVGTSCDEKTLKAAAQWFREFVTADTSGKYKGLVHEFVLNDSDCFVDSDDGDCRFVDAAQIYKRADSIIVHYTPRKQWSPAGRRSKRLGDRLPTRWVCGLNSRRPERG